MPRSEASSLRGRSQSARLSGRVGAAWRGLALAFALLPGGACAAAPEDGGAPDFVDVAELDARPVIEMRYAGPDNFTGGAVDGYEAARCLLARPAAEAIARVSARLAAAGLRLRIYDCYRPQRAVDRFAAWAAAPEDGRTRSAYYPNLEKDQLFALGYIAARSGHSRGAALDVTIDGLDMGGPWDLFDPASHHGAQGLSDEARAHRLLLKTLMEAEGFKPYAEEWWHYVLREEPYPERYFDFPITEEDPLGDEGPAP